MLTEVRAGINRKAGLRQDRIDVMAQALRTSHNSNLSELEAVAARANELEHRANKWIRPLLWFGGLSSLTALLVAVILFVISAVLVQDVYQRYAIYAAGTAGALILLTAIVVLVGVACGNLQAALARAALARQIRRVKSAKQEAAIEVTVKEAEQATRHDEERRQLDDERLRARGIAPVGTATVAAPSTATVWIARNWSAVATWLLGVALFVYLICPQYAIVVSFNGIKLIEGSFTLAPDAAKLEETGMPKENPLVAIAPYFIPVALLVAGMCAFVRKAAATFGAAVFAFGIEAVFYVGTLRYVRQLKFDEIDEGFTKIISSVQGFQWGFYLTVILTCAAAVVAVISKRYAGS